MTSLSWVEISKKAFINNIKELRRLVGSKTILCPCVKSNAYGHGMKECATAFLEAGADWLCVNSLQELEILRAAGVIAPIYILGYVPLNDLREVIKLDARIVVYNCETIAKLASFAKPVKVHLKAETGNNRQGLKTDELVDFAKYILQFKNIEIEGISTHFSNIEDADDHSYAEKQLRIFEESIKAIEELGIKIKFRHCANSAASMLFQKTHFEMVRPGIACYGLFPSEKIKKNDINLIPALSWKSRVVQVKKVLSGEYIGYGCTYKTQRETRLAIVPVGYYDGYDRGVKEAYVLIKGKKAPVRGRVCMNIIMVDATDIPLVNLEDEVTLIGRDGAEVITAEMFAKWAGTINYEVTTRINETLPRTLL